MLRLPDAVLQHIVSLVVEGSKDAQERNIANLKCTSKAMKAITKGEITRIKDLCRKIHDDLFANLPTLPIFKGLSIKTQTDPKEQPFGFLLSPRNAVVMVFASNDAIVILFDYKKHRNNMPWSGTLYATPRNDRSGHVRFEYGYGESLFFGMHGVKLGYCIPLIQLVEKWLETCYDPNGSQYGQNSIIDRSV